MTKEQVIKYFMLDQPRDELLLRLRKAPSAFLCLHLLFAGIEIGMLFMSRAFPKEPWAIALLALFVLAPIVLLPIGRSITNAVHCFSITLCDELAVLACGLYTSFLISWRAHIEQGTWLVSPMHIVALICAIIVWIAQVRNMRSEITRIVIREQETEQDILADIERESNHPRKRSLHMLLFTMLIVLFLPMLLVFKLDAGSALHVWLASHGINIGYAVFVLALLLFVPFSPHSILALHCSARFRLAEWFDHEKTN